MTEGRTYWTCPECGYKVQAFGSSLPFEMSATLDLEIGERIIEKHEATHLA